ncbi:hypothetical protein AG1IA_04915 [Rhizoctonia solani AG-1 IA]|uniref:Uncharacterized protein n=1 Tax=Thanatephorus cucumeris (strain AG1-IA) TaxID=983506 RepID=L8WW86_THACA|nr:hypothetical protein AG1IA_04915 [Rhizoctonia solani AG-1 IA]
MYNLTRTIKANARSCLMITCSSLFLFLPEAHQIKRLIQK